MNPDIFSRSVSFGCSEFNNDSDLTLDKAVKIAHAVETGRISKVDGYALAVLIDRGCFSDGGRVELD